MSAAAITAIAPTTDIRSIPCPHCGLTIPQDHSPAHRRIRELESQVKLLSTKATAAADKLADYEDELRTLKSPPPPHPRPSTADPSSPAPRISTEDPQPRPSTSTATTNPSRVSRLSSLLPARRSPHQGPEIELQAALARERSTRAQLDAMSGEMEDLSATLFQQANEMVAAERKARARLEERVRLLERRDGERRGRLERLERAVGRIERVRGVLGG